MKHWKKFAGAVSVTWAAYYLGRTIEDDTMVGPISRLSVLVLMPFDVIRCLIEGDWDDLKADFRDVAITMLPVRWQQTKPRTPRIKEWNPAAGAAVGHPNDWS